LVFLAIAQPNGGMWRLTALYLCLCVALGVRAQSPAKQTVYSNLRSKSVVVSSEPVSIDTLSIVPGSFSIAGIADSLYTIDLVEARLNWLKRPSLNSVQVRYRVFPIRLNAATARMNFDSIQNNFLGGPITYRPESDRKEERFFNFGNLNYNGSFGRGIAFGNNQDAVVTSNLNLQLNGYLADSIEFAAAITDNNIPIQPDGTTQQLNEFDRVFLQFKKKTWQLSLGDIDLRQNNSYFLNFYKRLQGASFETTTQLSENSSNKTLVSGSVAKGKFVRNIIQQLEGNQGPYRLTGANNELFFVVLANTERVFIDGALLQRGEEQDYVINYNTAEITFTPKRMITKDSRIQVEFEYADRNYLNTNLYLSNETSINKRLSIRVSAFSNGDAKSSPINQTLDPLQKQFLRGIGDSVNRAFYPVAIRDTFDAGRILYRRVDTLVAGRRDTIYVHALQPDSALYSLSFIDVGQGNADYVPDFNGANGKVYRWVAPRDNVRQGSFLPAAFLVAPKRQQVASLAMDYTVNAATTVSTEFGYSNYDINSFAEKDKTNDKGYAARVKINNTKTLQKSSLLTQAYYEFVNQRFKPLERLRNVEFTRDWGLPLLVTSADEHIVSGSAELTNKLDRSFRYDFTGYFRSDGFSGLRHTIVQQQDVAGWKFNNRVSITTSSSHTDRGYFLRPNLDVSKTFKRLNNYIAGASYSVEKNEIRARTNDSVSSASFDFNIMQVYLKSPEKNRNKWGASWYTRQDKYPLGKSLQRADRSQNINLFADLLANEKHQLRTNVTYRHLAVLNKAISLQQPEHTLLGRAEYLVNEWKGLLTGNLLYETGGGQEQRRDYSFLEVPAGQGQYTWIDYDNNGVQSLNEFEIAQFQDQARYIRIFTPSNSYIKANYTTLNYSVAINPRAGIDLLKANAIEKMLARMTLQSSLQISKKEVAGEKIQLNPFAKALNDNSLISLTSALINSFSFNRFSTTWGIDLNNTQTKNKALLTYGYESRDFEEWLLRGRYNVLKTVSLDLSLREGSNRLTTTNVNFDNRNYLLKNLSAEPRINFTQGSKFRLTSGYRFARKLNQEGEKERYLAHSLNTEIKYNILQSSSVLAKFTYTSISFEAITDQPAKTNSTVGYIMLDGLLPGRNLLWNLDLTKRLSNSLELNMQYEGRKPGDTRVIHTGRASLRALL
jgi:hypothetical protein